MRTLGARSTLLLTSLLWTTSWLPLAAQSAPPAPAGFTLQDVLDVKNVSIGDVSGDGRWVVVTTASLRDRLGTDNYRFGDPTYVGPGVAEISVLDARTGESRPLFREKRQTRSFSWSPDASRLAFLLRDGDGFTLALWDRAAARVRTIDPPAGRIYAENSTLEWTPDGARLLVGLRTTEWRDNARQRFDQEVKGPIVVQSSKDPFLSWDAIRGMSMNMAVAAYDVAAGRFQDVQPESRIRGYALAANGAMLRIEEDVREKTNYEQLGRPEAKISVRPLGTGDPRVLFPNDRGVTLQWSGDGASYAYARDGKLYFARVDGGEPKRLAGEDAPRPDSAAPPPDSTERARREAERFTPVRVSHDGAAVIASNREGLWLFDTATGARDRFQETAPEDDREAPRWSVLAWSRDGNDIYLSYASRTQWERGVHRYSRADRQTRQLVQDGRMYSGIELSDDGRTVVLTVAEGNQPGDVYTADSDFRELRRLTDANPGIAAKLGSSELIDYLDVDGNRLYGVLYYPLGYQAGTRVPTVFIVYETFFDNRFNSTVAYLTSNGYAVMQPSVNLERGYPGEAWMKGVTAAANELIEMGVADKDRLGVHGTSYGGYATNLLVTQTNRFAAAINISGKTDMISFYTDSPRLGVRNIHAPERSQDRIGATLWEQPQKYIAHSAVMFADRIRTPLLLMTGSQDHNVPERTTMEMFYALRRLGREVEWVSYVNGGHGMPTTTEAEVIDYHQRILGWYDRYLKSGEKRVTQESQGQGQS